MRAQAPQGAGTLNPGTGVEAFEASGSAQGDGGIEGADGDADLGVGRGCAALGGGDVGAALEQLRRNAEGDFGQGEIERREGGMLKSESFRLAMVPMACSNWARATPTSTSCARTVSSWVRAWATSASVPIPPSRRRWVRSSWRSRSVTVALSSLIWASRPRSWKYVDGHLGMKAQVDVRHVGGAGLGAGAGGLDGAADAAPEVGLPTGLAAKNEVVVIGGLAGERKRARSAETLLRAAERPGGERGKEGGAGHGDLVAGGEIGFQRLAQGLVVGGDALFELVELRVLVDLPPFAAQHAVGGVGGLPSAPGGSGRWGEDGGRAGFLVGRGSVVGGDGCSWGLRACRR